MSAMGTMISKKRGRASMVSTQKEALEAPDSMTSSKKRRDCVRRMTALNTADINIAAMARFLNMYHSNNLMEDRCSVSVF